MANREELNAQAVELGIENPESYGTKAELQTVIDETQNVENNETEETTTAPEPAVETSEEPSDEGTSRDEAVAIGKNTAVENIKREQEQNQAGE